MHQKRIKYLILEHMGRHCWSDLSCMHSGANSKVVLGHSKITLSNSKGKSLLASSPYRGVILTVYTKFETLSSTALDNKWDSDDNGNHGNEN